MSRTDKEPGKNPVKRPTERPIKRRFILASLALTSVVLTLAAAAPAMAMNCMMAASPRLVFGEYDPKSPLPHDVQGSLSIQCTPASPGEVVDVKGSLVGVSDTQLYVRNPQTGDRLRVGLYRDSARSQPINPQELLWFRFPLVVTTTLTLPLYGRIPAGQDVSAGSYQADFTLLIDF